MKKIQIHGVIGSQPTRAALIVAKIIGLDVELKEQLPYNKGPEFKNLSPQQTIPVLVDDGFILPERQVRFKVMIIFNL